MNVRYIGHNPKVAPKSHIPHPKARMISLHPKKKNGALSPCKRLKSPRNLTVISEYSKSHTSDISLHLTRCRAHRAGRADDFAVSLYMKNPVPSIENGLSCNNVIF
jgi:hypothetical protein